MSATMQITLHACDEDLATLIVRLESAANRAVEWFKQSFEIKS